MNAGERANLQEAVRVSQDPNATPDQIKQAGQVQRNLREKYPDTYGAIRREMFENVTNMSQGGDTPKKGRKKVPAISISVGMVEIPKGKGKAKMMKGGMANGRQHMYLNEGALVTDNLNPGLKALAKKRPDVVKKILKKS